MPTPPACHLPQQQTKPDEHILVVKRNALFPQGAWHGIRECSFEQFIPLIEQHHEFQPRSIMEIDPNYKQIIPYLIFTHEGRYFLMQRHAKASEQRLKNKLTLGIGGHIRREDMCGPDVFAWALREFHEEVHYEAALRVEPVGIINDDTTPVGEVHLGMVMLLHGDSNAISIKSELQSGELVSLEECHTRIGLMESWSQFALTLLATKITATK